MGRKRKRKREGRRVGTRVVTLTTHRLELARGHDGPLRGLPEPCLVLGVFGVTERGASLSERSVLRLQSVAPHPEVIEHELRLEARIPRREDLSIVVLAFAVEDDGGDALAHLYQALSTPERLSFWRASERDPDPATLAEWCARPPLPAPATETVHALDGDADLRDAKLGDDYVGCALFHLTGEKQPTFERRLRFVSADERNDWTLVLSLRVV